MIEVRAVFSRCRTNLENCVKNFRFSRKQKNTEWLREYHVVGTRRRWSRSHCLKLRFRCLRPSSFARSQRLDNHFGLGVECCVVCFPVKEIRGQAVKNLDSVSALPSLAKNVVIKI